MFAARTFALTRGASGLSAEAHAAAVEQIHASGGRVLPLKEALPQGQVIIVAGAAATLASVARASDVAPAALAAALRGSAHCVSVAFLAAAAAAGACPDTAAFALGGDLGGPALVPAQVSHTSAGKRPRTDEGEAVVIEEEGAGGSAKRRREEEEGVVEVVEEGAGASTAPRAARPLPAFGPALVIGGGSAGWTPAGLATLSRTDPTPVPYPRPGEFEAPPRALAKASGIARPPVWMAPSTALDVTSGAERCGRWLLTSTSGLSTPDIAAASATVLNLPSFASAGGNVLRSAGACPHAAALEALTPASMGTCAFAAFPGSAGGTSVRPSSRIFALDVDGTVLKPAGGGAFCNTATDWVMWHARVPERLRAAHEAGYKVVLLSNQMGVGKGRTTLAIVTARVEAFAKAVNVPMQVFLAPCEDGYRKPMPGSAWLLSTFANAGVPIDAAGSIYVGDAAGRPKATGRPKKDHADTDMGWALNQGWAFTTPEALFGGSPALIDRDPLSRAVKTATGDVLPAEPTFDLVPVLALPAPGSKPGLDDGAGGSGCASLAELAATPNAFDARQEVVLLSGPAASGKSTLTGTAFSLSKGYVRVNQDTLKTRDKCMEVAAAVVEGRAALPSIPPGAVVPFHPGRRASVVVDATNLDVGTRAAWVAWAKQRGLRIRLVAISIEKPLAVHLNTVRGTCPLSAERRVVPAVVIHANFKNGVMLMSAAAAMAEGFSSFARVRFVPGPYCDTGAAVPCDGCALARSFIYGLA